MKSTRKHELQTNELADALGHLIERARPHGVAIASVGLVIVAAIIVMVVVPALRSGLTPEAEVGLAFADAQLSGESTPLRNFLRDKPATSPQVPVAKMLLAERIIRDVAANIDVTGAGDVKSKAPALLLEAKEFYSQAAQASPNLAPLCEVGTALATIQQGDVEPGRKALEELAKKYEGSPAGDVATKHLEDLAAYKPIAFSGEALATPTPTTATNRPPPLLMRPTGTEGLPPMTATPTGSAAGPEMRATPTGSPMRLPAITLPTRTTGPVMIVPEKPPVIEPPVVLPTGTTKAPDATPTPTPKAPDVKPAGTGAPKG